MEFFATGLYIGDTLVGNGKQTNGCDMDVVEQGNFRSCLPLEEKYRKIRENIVMPPISKPNYHHAIALENHPAYSGFTTNDIYDILNILYTEGYEDTLFYRFEFVVKFTSIDSKSFFTEKLTPEMLETLMSENVNLKVVNDMFPRRANSKAKEPTLVFRYNNWRIKHATTVVKTFADCFYLDKKIVPDYKTHHISNIPLLNDSYIAIPLTEHISFDEAYGILKELYGIKLKPDYFFKVTPSILKSVLQKVIRSRSDRGSTDVDGTVIPSTHILLLAFTTLLLHVKKYFLPSLQKYSTGIESACKRLAVSIVEDSYTDTPIDLVELFQRAYIENTGVNTTIDRATFIRYCKMAVDAFNSGYAYKYKVTSADIVFDTKNHYKHAGYILSKIGSFETDINMFFHVSGVYKGTPLEGLQIPIVHYLDQHCYPEIAYLSDGKRSFKEFFSYMWDNSSKFNPRKSECIIEIPAEIIAMQCEAWAYIFGLQVNPPLPYTVKTIDYKYKPIDLCGMMQIEVKYNATTYIIVTKYTDRFYPVIFLKPSRNCTDKTVSEEVKRILMDRFENIITTTGVKLKSNNYLNGLFLKLNPDGEYTINGVPLDAALSYSVDVHETDHILPDITNRNVANRMSVFIKPKCDTIHLYKINMHGESIYEKANNIDIEISKWLREFSIKYPNILIVENPISFTVNCPEFLYDVYRSKIAVLPSKSKERSFEFNADTTRQMFPHQKLILDELMTRYPTIQKHAIWMDVGTGKTSLTCWYIYNIIKDVNCVIWTVPKAAVEHIEKEIRRFTSRVVIYENEIKDGYVNIIPHDTMRSLEIPDFEYMFVCDEFHKTLDNTLRTSACINFANAARHMVCLTGTMIKDRKVEKLIAWLSMCCSYKVDENNYWCAFAQTMIESMKTDCVYEREVLNIGIGDIDTYKSLVPYTLGGNCKNFNIFAALNFLYDNMIPAMCEVILDLLYNMKRRGVFVVCNNENMCLKVQDMLLGHLRRDEVIVPSGQFPCIDSSYTGPVKVVIVTFRKCEGYSMTYLDSMVTSVYPTNIANIVQIEARINRVSQTNKHLWHYTLLSGFLEAFHDRQKKGVQFMDCVKSFTE